MAEEWGSIVIKAPVDVRKAFIEHQDDLLIAIKQLVEFSGADISLVDQESLHADSVTNKLGFIKLDYDCSTWVDFSAAMLRSAQNISYYGRHGDEYGTNTYFSLGPKGKKVTVVHDLEEEEDDQRKLIELGRWVSSLPAALTSAFADFNPLKECDYIKPNAQRKRIKREPQVNLYCYFAQSVSEDEVRQRISPEYHDFSCRQKSNDGLADLLLSVFFNAEEKSDKPGPQIFHWFPICDDRSKSAEDLLNELKEVSVSPIYAHNFIGESSHPHRILRCDKDGTEEILNSDDHTEADLKLLSESEDREVGRKVNWFTAEFDFIEQIHEKFGLKQYADENIARLKKEAKRALHAQREAHEKIWAEHSDQIVPALSDIRFYYYFQKLDPAMAEASARRLQQKGMWMEGMERGLGYSGSNTICVQERQRGVAEWLKENVDEMSGHRVMIDDDVDAVVINMQ